jgi:hypothetical protein
MGFASEIRAAAAEAQGHLAQLQGMEPDAVGNVLFSGHTVPLVGVFSRPVVQWVPQVGGGYRKKTSQVVSITRAQLATPPKENTKLARVDVTPPTHYAIEHVNTGNPLAWEIHVNRFDA